MDIGSNERMNMQNLQIPETAESRIVLALPTPLSDKDRLPPAAQILCWLLPSLQKHKNHTLL